jgi:hypothetical protein
MNIIQARDVEHAIEIASDLKSAGTYDWFRGQVRRWEPASSLERKLKSSDFDKAAFHARLNRIINWMSGIPELHYLTLEENINAFCAVLQHYGVPTSYIDFSTEPGVAGFFASDTQTPPADGEQSVIYCLNTADLNRFYEGLENYGDMELETVTVDVSNLWRLSAQCGHFVYANHPWYLFYDPDCIVFPWSGCPAYPRKEDIYPSHKSPLEQRLDEYFLLERSRENDRYMRELVAQGDIPFVIYDISSPLYMSNYFSGELGTLDSWSESSLAIWRSSEPQRFPVGTTYARSLTLRTSDGSPPLSRQAETALSIFLRQDVDARKKPIDWRVAIGPNADLRVIDSALRTVWNGMRHLPFTDKQVALAMANTLELVADLRGENVINLEREVKNRIAEGTSVDFGAESSLGSKAYCSSSALVQAVDKEWARRLTDKELMKDARRILQICRAPHFMFDFASFAELFAAQIIPTQIALMRESPMFNPAEVTTFGLP